MVSMNTSGQNGGEGSSGLVISSGPAGNNNGGGIEQGSSRSGLTTVSNAVVECHNNNKNNSNNTNRICNINEANTWKALYPDPVKMNKLREIVENSTSASSRSVIESILHQVNQLSDIERIFLYLKLPGGRAPELDPLKQPLNPLGSRSEIQLTITWMNTHLEVDLDVSLPKEEVYKDYMDYCNNNGFKPLSTADFGKVMKQVFPTVRARRLGHRGASKYCHSGLKKKYFLEPPRLQDLSEEISKKCCNSSKSLYGLPMPCDEAQKSTLNLIMEWAVQMLKVKFETFRDLALFLLDKKYVDSGSADAYILVNSVQMPNNALGKHRETQLQLQKKLQEKEHREQKRKLQEQQQAGVSRLCSDRPKTRRRSGTAKNVHGGPEAPCANNRNSNATPGLGGGGFGSSKTFVAGASSSDTKAVAVTKNERLESGGKDNKNCNDLEFTEGEEKPKIPLNSLTSSIKQEDSARLSFSSLFIGNDEKNGICTNNIDSIGRVNANNCHENPYSASEKFPSKFIRANSVDDPTQGASALVKGVCNGNPKTYYMFTNVPQSGSSGSQTSSNKNRYIPIQPKVGQCENISNNNNNNNNNGNNKCSNVSNNSLVNNKFVNSSSSQWTEASTLLDSGKSQSEACPGPSQGTAMEQSQPNQNMISQPCADQDDFMSYANAELEDPQKSNKISELKKLLQNNLPGVSPATGMAPVPLELPDDPSIDLDHDGMNNSGIHRRVSFQTSSSSMEGSEGTVTNPLFSQSINQVMPQGSISCPKTYNFTPIVSNINNPCGGVSQGVSQASSANASPFMSPRNTPLPRSRHNSGQTSSTYVTPRSTPYTPDMAMQGDFTSENSTPFMSPAPTPIFQRSRHNSSQNLHTHYTPTCRSRHSSGAPSYRHTPYADDMGGRRNKYRSRHSSGSIPPSPQSAPMSPLVHDSNSHPITDSILFHQQLSSSTSHSLMQKHHQTPVGTSNDMRRRHMSAGPSIAYQPQSQPLPMNFNISGVGANNDLLSQEISNVMNNPQVGVNTTTSNNNRPQSVPLPQMLNTSCTDMDYIAKSHPNTPLVNQQFHFGQEFSLSHPSSYAPTPVPSDCNDFGEYSNIEFDPVLTGDTNATNSGLESINATFPGFENHPDLNLASAISDSLNGVSSGVSGIMESSYVDAVNGRFAQCEEAISSASMQSAVEPSCGPVLSYPVTKENNTQAQNRNAFLCAKGEASQPAPTAQSLMISGSSHMTLNELNAQSCLANLTVSEASFSDPPSSHLEEEFQPTLDEFGGQGVLDSIVLDVSKD